MKSGRFLNSKYACVLFLCIGFLLVLPSQTEAQPHPFLLVKSNDYEMLRNRSAFLPWSQMKTSARHDALTLQYNPAVSDIEEKSLRLRDIISAALLSYILDPDSAARYVDVVHSALLQLDNLQNSRGDYNDWASQVPVANAAFHALLALDILYDEFEQNEREEIEDLIEQIVSTLNTDAWRLSAYAALGTWALYKNDRDKIDLYKNAYRTEIGVLLTSDGIFNGGTGYATSRFTKHAREQKFVFMDILEHTGEDSWYTDPRLQNLYEWLFAHVFVTHAAIAIFGDAKLGTSARRRLNRSPAAYGAHHFSEQAGHHAAWHLADSLPPGRLTIYLAADTVMAPQRPDISHIYNDGGAWFVHNPDDESLMSAALWNPKSESDHSHKEVNSINLAAFGEFLMVNSGYSNWGNGSLGFSWDYIHNTAVSSNTVLNFHSDHVSKSGAGIDEGFIHKDLSYASGNSGQALHKGQHNRNLIFVPPAQNTEGYWILFDEMTGASPGTQMNVALHPYSSAQPVEISTDEYEWSIQRWSENPVKLNIFLASEPLGKQFIEGVQADKDRSINSHYLYSTYAVDDSGYARAATVLFPHNMQHSKAAMSRLNEDGFQSAKIEFSENLYDVIAQSSAKENISVENNVFRGKSLLYRQQDGQLLSYFVRKGNVFDAAYSGFNSDKAVSIFMKDNQGKLISPGTNITFFAPGLNEVLLNGVTASHEARGDDWITIYAEQGTHDIVLVSSATSLSDKANSNPNKFFVSRAYPNPFNAVTNIRINLPEAGLVTIELYDVLGRRIKTYLASWQTSGQQRFKMDASGLPSATYIYKVTAQSLDKTYVSHGKVILTK